MDNDLRSFQATKAYSVPKMPTDESLRRVGWKLWRWRQGKTDQDPFIDDESLNLANDDQLDHLVAGPACGPLLDELDLTFDDWIAGSSCNHRVQLVVIPPCDREDILSTWARSKGHRLVEPPPRETLMASQAPTLRFNESANLLVVPRLERWFLRHHNGLQAMERLLEMVQSTQQQIIVGCNSWAYHFLRKAVQTDLVFSTSLTFQPFDKDRLANWFSRLSASEDSRKSVFRFSDSGETIFGDEAPKRKSDDYFATLAARSRGAPWVAWHLWRQSLKLGPNQDADLEQKFPTERTVWVSKLRELSMPSDEVDAGLLILQALLIHDRLTPTELATMVPNIQRSNVLAAILRAGFVRRDGESFCCEPAAYPVIRERLVGAGFPAPAL